MKLNKLFWFLKSNDGWRRTGILQIEVYHGHVSPFWYGIAWWHPEKMAAVCYPIPLNWLLWSLREVYWKLKFTPLRNNHPMWKEGFNAGYREGLALGKLSNKWTNTNE